MYTAWTRNLRDPEEKASFERSVISAKPVLKRLQDLLTEMKKDLDNIETDVRVFEKPNWSEKQAYYNGYRSCIKIVNKLIDLDQQKDTTHDPRLIDG